MKVKIGKYLSWVGPYQLVDMLFFWHEKYPENNIAKRWDYQLHDRMSDWLASTWVADFCSWLYSKRQRTIKIHIDDYDVWSMDSTLSLIVVPMLKKLKEHKHGAPWVEDKDVPKELRSTSAPPKKNSWDTDDNHFKRWDWVMDEMIWAHEQLIDDDGDSKFFDHSTADNPKDDLNTQISKIKVDRKGLKAHHDRINNGLRLFGKYYRGLWD